jgi:hypothetical protein
MEEVIHSINQLTSAPDEKGIKLLSNNQATLQHKKQLLAEQLSMVSKETYSADTLFSLNSRYGLSDQ